MQMKKTCRTRSLNPASSLPRHFEGYEKEGGDLASKTTALNSPDQRRLLDVVSLSAAEKRIAAAQGHPGRL
ncbi:hypothetical protein SKAU_G00364240 [Synaphobranchus kaupii]|uniref:Uncharacterized protein n=1 Tax=Synaphobranchus kaupii TaxID=118154 RepID=A0A9Q1EES3_SYNKA|nr:hypothetical protein SKAU_G00364240 [Synaphobranchus kaupii]